ncbi:hypothetical protein ABPG75_003003 [Micractinium tetrahymenae]
MPTADGPACHGGLRCGSGRGSLHAGSGMLHASSHLAQEDRSGALRWLHGWATLASGEVEPSVGPRHAAPAAPRGDAAPTSPANHSASSCGPSNGSLAGTVPSGHLQGSPHSLASAGDSLLPPAPPGGHLACSSLPLPTPPPPRQLHLRCQRQAGKPRKAEQAAAVPAGGANTTGRQKRRRTEAAAPGQAGEPGWAARLTQALQEAAAAMSMELAAVAEHPSRDGSRPLAAQRFKSNLAAAALSLALL